MKATYNDTVQMDWLLIYARTVLAEAEELSAGRKVRITLRGEGDTLIFTCPARVAMYARHAMGQPAPTWQEGQVVFFSRGVALAFFPSGEGGADLLRALIAHNYAQQRRQRRQLAVTKAKLGQNEATRRNQNTSLSAGEREEVQS
jgi:hypothetical protein